MRQYNGWEIEKIGGYVTFTRFEAHKGEKWLWAFRLFECKQFCDDSDNGKTIPPLYLRPLYQ